VKGIHEEQCRKTKIAYGWIYEVERSLKSLIEYHLRHEYGLGWKSKIYEKRKLEVAYFHETISYFGKYPPLLNIFTSHELHELYKTTTIRNRICHMKFLLEDEFEHLYGGYQMGQNKKERSIQYNHQQEMLTEQYISTKRSLNFRDLFVSIKQK